MCRIINVLVHKQKLYFSPNLLWRVYRKDEWVRIYPFYFIPYLVMSSVMLCVLYQTDSVSSIIKKKKSINLFLDRIYVILCSSFSWVSKGVASSDGRVKKYQKLNLCTCTWVCSMGHYNMWVTVRKETRLETRRVIYTSQYIANAWAVQILFSPHNSHSFTIGKNQARHHLN